MLKNRSVTPAPGGPFDPEELRDQASDDVAADVRGPDDAPRADGSGGETPDRDADEGMARVEDAVTDDVATDDRDAGDEGVGAPPTGDDPGPGPDADDPMGGAAPSG